MRRTAYLASTLLAGLALGLALAGGCKSAPPKVITIKAAVNLEGRRVVIVPFGTPRDVRAEDGVKVAEFAARELRAVVPEAKVEGPGTMQAVLSDAALLEAGWAAVAKKVGATILVTGDIVDLSMYPDPALGIAVGAINVRFLVFDVSADVPKRLGGADWNISFPDDLDERADGSPPTTDLGVAREELLRLTGRRISAVFYDRKVPAGRLSKYEVRWWFGPAGGDRTPGGPGANPHSGGTLR